MMDNTFLNLWIIQQTIVQGLKDVFTAQSSGFDQKDKPIFFFISKIAFKQCDLGIVICGNAGLFTMGKVFFDFTQFSLCLFFTYTGMIIQRSFNLIPVPSC